MTSGAVRGAGSTSVVTEPPSVVSAGRARTLAGCARRGREGVAWRGETAARKRAFVRRGGVEPDDDSAAALDSAVERVLGTADQLPGLWLGRGAAVADAVALIETDAGSATGFLVSPWLLLTNRHVLPAADAAAGARASFRAVLDARGRMNRVRTLDLEPDRFFVAGTGLDYALVALAGIEPGTAPGSVFGVLPLIPSIGKIVLGQPVNIVGHPQGRPREIAVRENRLLDLDDDHLTYETDTEPGSSGSPAFNDRWEVVALHRRGVEAADPYRSGSGSGSGRRWVANEGVRVSSIVADLAGRGAPPGGEGLLTELLEVGS